MKFIRNKSLEGFAFATLTSLCGIGGVHAQEAKGLRLDTPEQVKGVETVCTGVGLDARQDPRWDAYSMKIEIAGKGGQFLGDVQVTVAKDGRNLLEVDCNGPWVLFKLASGRYQIAATTAGKTVSSAAFVPATGQGRIILRFPELGGELEKVPETSPNPATN